MFEQLRSAHIRTLEAMGQLKRENAELQKRVTELERSAKPGSDRMKPEELDSLYVEERRIIESLERENKELKTAVLGARAAVGQRYLFPADEDVRDRSVGRVMINIDGRGEDPGLREPRGHQAREATHHEGERGVFLRR